MNTFDYAEALAKALATILPLADGEAHTRRQSAANGEELKLVDGYDKDIRQARELLRQWDDA